MDDRDVIIVSVSAWVTVGVILGVIFVRRWWSMR